MPEYIYGLPTHDVTRDFFFNISDGYGLIRWVILFLFILAFVRAAYSINKKAKNWFKGKKGLFPGFSFKRIKRTTAEILLHRRIMKDNQAGIGYLLIFAGIFSAIILYSAAFIQEYFTVPIYGHYFINGNIYLAWNLVSDISSFLIITGIFFSLLRRFVIKPSSLVTTRTDLLMILIIASIVFTGILHNAIRIAISDFPSFEVFSPITYLISKIFFFPTEQTLERIHSLVWITNIGLTLLLISLLGSSTLIGRIVLSFLNIYCAPLCDDESCTKYQIKIPETEPEMMGASRIDDFSWKDLMDIDSCIMCGRCQERCPASLTGMPLSPKKLLSDLSLCSSEYLANDHTIGQTGEIAAHVKRDEVWACTMCAECTEVCPSHIDPMKKIHEIRKAYISSNELPDGIRALDEKVSSENNSSGTKGEWFRSIAGVNPLSEIQGSGYLFFAGCKVAHDVKSADEARAFLSILTGAGISAGVLGLEELCCGDALLRAGNINSFKKLAFGNIALFKKYNVKKIITICPHGYNVLNKEYRSLIQTLPEEQRPSYEVLHYTQVLHSLVSEGKIFLIQNGGSVITYHDPCFLGRYNNEYIDARAVIDSVHGNMRIEMTRSKQESMCCGGPLSINGTDGKKIAEFRARDVHSSGARTVITSCPHCTSMLDSGFRTASIDSVKVKGIASFIFESLRGR